MSNQRCECGRPLPDFANREDLVALAQIVKHALVDLHVELPASCLRKQGGPLATVIGLLIDRGIWNAVPDPRDSLSSSVLANDAIRTLCT